MDTGPGGAEWNMAFDEAMLERCVSGASGGAALRFYSWERPAVTLGYACPWGANANHEACSRRGVPVVRRISGGGAVLHDMEITWSLVAPVSLFDNKRGLVFRRAGRAVIAAAAALGLPGATRRRNDVLAPNGRKICGCAAVHRGPAVLVHGTLLLDADPDFMFSLLKVPEDKTRRQNLPRPHARITSLARELGRDMDYAEAAHALRQGFARAFKTSLQPAAAAPALLHAARALQTWKYSSAEWNRDRRIPMQRISFN